MEKLGKKKGIHFKRNSTAKVEFLVRDIHFLLQKEVLHLNCQSVEGNVRHLSLFKAINRKEAKKKSKKRNQLLHQTATCFTNEILRDEKFFGMTFIEHIRLKILSICTAVHHLRNGGFASHRVPTDNPGNRCSR